MNALSSNVVVKAYCHSPLLPSLFSNVVAKLEQDAYLARLYMIRAKASETWGKKPSRAVFVTLGLQAVQMPQGYLRLALNPQTSCGERTLALI